MISSIGLFGAMLAGLISFLSPCVLPLVPPYLCFITGVSLEELKQPAQNKTRILMLALAFVLGFTTVFVSLGASASFLSRFLARNMDIFTLLAGGMIIIMGLHFLGVFKIGLFYKEARVEVSRRPAGILPAYLVGLAFAFGWTPCIGPVLASILALAASEETILKGAMLLLFYSLGLGIPFLLAAAFVVPFLGWASKFKRHLGLVEKIMGLLLVITGILFISGSMAQISGFLLETFPILGKLG